MDTSRALVPHKACPVVIRNPAAPEILAFEHPLAGLQLVKGTIEPGGTPAAAAVRELYEESGLIVSGAVADLGLWASGYQCQVWSFHWCPVRCAPDAWMHRTQDGGGLAFRFFWHALADGVSSQWHRVYRDALRFISSRALPIAVWQDN